MTKILVIDDEPSIINLVSAYLKPEGYEVYTAADGNAGLKAARAFKPDLIILDLMLPGIDGIELLTRLRRESDVYVIMLTARTDETDKIVGLSVGADDYVTKPFSPRELTARVKAALRRLQVAAGSGGERSVLSFRHVKVDVGAHVVTVDESPIELTSIEFELLKALAENHGRVLSFKHVLIDVGAHTVSVNDVPVELTSIEFDLLRALAENRGRVLSREQLLEKIWGAEYFGEMRVVDVHLGHVRQKLGNESLIATVRGVGYRFEDEAL